MTGTDGQGSTACRNITIIDDNSLEGEHNFTVFLEDFDIVAGAPDTARIFMGTPSSATVVIEDNEGKLLVYYCPYCLHGPFTELSHTDATVSLTKSVYEVSEGNGTVAVCVSILDVPSEGLECEIEVMLESSNGLKAGSSSNINAVYVLSILVGKAQCHCVYNVLQSTLVCVIALLLNLASCTADCLVASPALNQNIYNCSENRRTLR